MISNIEVMRKAGRVRATAHTYDQIRMAKRYALLAHQHCDRVGGTPSYSLHMAYQNGLKQ